MYLIITIQYLMKKGNIKIYEETISRNSYLEYQFLNINFSK